MEYLSSDSVRLSEDEKSVVIIDQTKLPNETEYLTLSEADELHGTSPYLFSLPYRY